MSEEFYVVFTNPAIDYDEDRIDNHIDMLMALIQDTPRGESILGIISHFESTDIADKFIAAAKKGVKVKLIIRSDQDGIINYFHSKDPLCKVKIKRACGCFGKRIHSKLFLFSKTVWNGILYNNVAIAGSATLTSNSLTKHQNMVLISDSLLYTSLVAFWKRSRDEAHLLASRSVKNVSEEYYTINKMAKVYLFPYLYKDPVVNIIRNFKPTLHLSTHARSIARIAMSRWSESRKKILIEIEKLLKEKNGCIFDIVYRDGWFVAEEGAWNAVDPYTIGELYRLRNTYPGRVILRKGTVGQSPTDVHSKYLLFEGYYASGSAWEKIVWTGSENYTYPGKAENDDIMVKIRNDVIYQKFVENHQLLKSMLVEP